MALPFSRLSAFQWLLRWDQRLRQEITPAGRMVITGIALTAAFGIDTQISLAYQFFALLFSLFLVAIVPTFLFRPHLAVRRELPPFATVGTPVSYDIHIVNQGKRSWHDLRVREWRSYPVITPEAFAHARDPEEAGRNGFDRRMGFQRFLWLVRQERGLEVEPVPLATLAAGEQARVTLTALPLRRGRARLHQVAVLHPEPLGLLQGRRYYPLPGEILILPKRHPIPPHLRVAGKRRYQHGGVSLTSSVGDAEEFIGMRAYREGDPLRRIHWPSWAKCGQPVVREFQEEYFVRNALVLDTGQDGEVFEEAVSLAAGFVSEADGGEALLDLLLAGPGPELHTFGRGVAHGGAMLELLAAITAHPGLPLAPLTGLVMAHAAGMSGCILVLTAWDQERQGLVAALLAHEVPVRVLLVHPAGSARPRDPGPLTRDPGSFLPLEAGRIPLLLASAGTVR